MTTSPAAPRRARTLLTAAGTLALAALGGCAATPPPAPPLGRDPSREAPFPGGPVREATFGGLERRSTYLTMRDGVRLAVDWWLPSGAPADARRPTVLFQTRYWRSPDIRWPFSWFVSRTEVQGLVGQVREFLVRRGYAWVDVDVRGSGASFGTRPWDYAPDEIRDGAEVVDWIVGQPWSDGQVATAGASYVGSTAEFALVNRHPAIRATVNISSEFDQYDDILFPGGVPLRFYLDAWGAATQALDRNEIPGATWRERLGSSGVAPTDDPDAGALRDRAVREHEANYDFRELTRFTYRDDFLLAPSAGAGSPRPAARAAAESSAYAWLAARFGPGFRARGVDLASQHAYAADIAASGARMLLVAGWMDGSYANSMIRRLNTYPAGQARVIIGPWDHHQVNVSPASGGARSRFDLMAELLRFLDETLGVAPPPAAETARVQYYVMGAEAWRAADQWPPPATRVRWHLAPARALAPAAPATVHEDALAHDSTSGTGRDSRWDTLMGRVLRTPYPDRAARDARLLAYDTPPLERDLEVTGHPEVQVVLRATARDAAVFAYLEDVAPDGTVTMITEGQLRALHRREAREAPPYWKAGPWHSYRKADAAPLSVGDTATLRFELLPTSYRFAAGHRLRLAIAAHDRDHFAPVVVPDGGPALVVRSGGGAASWIEVPVVPAAPERR